LLVVKKGQGLFFVITEEKKFHFFTKNLDLNFSLEYLTKKVGAFGEKHCTISPKNKRGRSCQYTAVPPLFFLKEIFTVVFD